MCAIGARVFHNTQDTSRTIIMGDIKVIKALKVIGGCCNIRYRESAKCQ